MSYSIEIAPSARREWKKLDHDIKIQLVKKLEKILDNPRIAALRLSSMSDCYKIKLRSKGYRLIYQIFDDRLILMIIAVGKRDASKNDVYDLAKTRILGQ